MKTVKTLTRHGYTCQWIDDLRKEVTVDNVVELESPLDEEQSAIDDEDDIEDGEGQQEVVEDVALFHGHNGEQTQNVA